MSAMPRAVPVGEDDEEGHDARLRQRRVRLSQRSSADHADTADAHAHRLAPRALSQAPKMSDRISESKAKPLALALSLTFAFRPLPFAFTVKVSRGRRTRPSSDAVYRDWRDDKRRSPARSLCRRD